MKGHHAECKNCGALFVPGGKLSTEICAGCYMEQLIEAEALLLRCQKLLNGKDAATDLYCEINDYYKQYIQPTHN